MEAINLGRREFIDNDGQLYPVVTMLDGNGDECGPENAVVAVAGTEGRWLVLDLSEFETGAFQ